MFIREFSVIDSAMSGEQLRMRLKDRELEEYGEAFTPEFVYEVIRRLPRFSSMRVRTNLLTLPYIRLTESLEGSSARRRRIPWILTRRDARRMCTYHERRAIFVFAT